MNDFSISVIIPVYNAVGSLAAAVGSVLAHDPKNIEIIAVDDGSDDGSAGLLDSIAAKDGRVRVIHRENGGQFAARQQGIAAARGEYLMFVDSDDTIEADSMSIIREALADGDTDILMFCGSIYENGMPTGRSIGELCDSAGAVAVEKLRQSLAFSNDSNSLCTKVFRRGLFEGDTTDYSAFCGTCCGEDKARLLYPVTAAKKIKYIPDRLYRYDHREGSAMRSCGVESIKRMMAGEMFCLVLGYMKRWGMDDSASLERFFVYYLRNYLSVYYGVRKRLETTDERRAFRRYPWRDVIMSDALKYRGSVLLSKKEKIMLAAAAMWL